MSVTMFCVCAGPHYHTHTRVKYNINTIKGIDHRDIKTRHVGMQERSYRESQGSGSQRVDQSQNDLDNHVDGDGFGIVH